MINTKITMSHPLKKQRYCMVKKNAMHRLEKTMSRVKDMAYVMAVFFISVFFHGCGINKERIHQF